jgi:hypothetical protein
MNANSDRIDSDPSFTPYTDTRALARLAAAAFVLMAAVCWTAAGYDIGEVRSVGAVAAEGAHDHARHLAHQKAGMLLRVAQLTGALLVAAAFLPWLYQVRANLRAFGLRHLRFSREWTYLSFVVPGLNAVRPLRVVSEVWRGSVSRSSDPVAWRTLATPGLVTTWWLTFVAWVVVGAGASILISLATSIGARIVGHGFALLADGAAALSASLGYLLVMRIQRAQEERSASRETQALPEALLRGRLIA